VTKEEVIEFNKAAAAEIQALIDELKADTKQRIAAKRVELRALEQAIRALEGKVIHVQTTKPEGVEPKKGKRNA
jgi:hypothetical protein